MGIWRLKSCPRCRGDIFIELDAEKRWYEQCLQCGYSNELKDIAEFREQLGERKRKPVLAGETQHGRYS